MAKLWKRKSRGNRFYLDYYDIDGKRYQLDTGCTNLDEAKRWLRKFEEFSYLAKKGEIEKVGRITAEDVEGKARQKEQKNRIKMSDYQKQHENIASNLKKKTLENYRLAFVSYIALKGNPYLDEIDPSDVLSWQEKLRAEGKSKTTESMYGRALKSAMNRAVELEYLSRNPFAKVRYPSQRETRRTDKTMKVEEVQALLKLIDGKGASEQQFGNYVRCLMYTGCRRGEILTLRGENVDLENRILTVTVTKKRGEPIKMKIPINKALYQVLSKMDIKPGEYVFKTTARKKSLRERGRYWSPYYASSHFKEFIEKAGLSERYSLHSLRKVYVSHLHSLGVPIDVIQRLVGHSSPTITWLEYSTTDALSFRKYADLIDFDSTSLEDRLEVKPDTNSETSL